MPYGIDEYFTNVILYDYIVQNKIKVMIQNNIMIKNLINRLYYSKIIKNQDSSKENMIKLSKMVLKNKNKLIRKNPKIDRRFFTTCPQQFLDNLDKVDNNYIYVTFFN